MGHSTRQGSLTKTPADYSNLDIDVLIYQKKKYTDLKGVTDPLYVEQANENTRKRTAQTTYLMFCDFLKGVDLYWYATTPVLDFLENIGLDVNRAIDGNVAIIQVFSTLKRDNDHLKNYYEYANN